MVISPKGILTNQRLLGLQKLKGTFFPCPLLWHIFYFVVTDTKLFNKSIPGKR